MGMKSAIVPKTINHADEGSGVGEKASLFPEVDAKMLSVPSGNISWT